MSDPVDNAALAATLATADPTSTIRPSPVGDTVSAAGLERTLADTAAGAASAVLEPLAQRLVLGTTLGEGGMAVVRVARQTSLGREVAVKVLREDATDAASPRMLREAWITGALEHPNIVPVHDLGRDDRGRPMIVLKRIEGRPWSDLIGKADEIRARFGVDALEWNLQTLVHVCHAIAFAHSRGIVHRDLKPANIMIGGFGEVYVLDWGIAVSLVDDGSGRLPLAADCSEMAGTLAYMAPEMLGALPLTERTDVYLLGAILHEIATGKPPHMCESMTATLESIARSQFLLADAPAELTAICRRALAKDPADRYASADELRLAIIGFLEHRGSAAIAHDAHDQLYELIGHLAGGEDPSTGVDRVRTYQLFGQARFGFQAALRAWPGNTAARAGLDIALSRMASYELDHGDTRAAALLIAERSTPDPELSDRLATVERRAAEKAAHLARLEADQDAVQGRLGRTLFLIVFGLAWTMMPLVASIMPAIHIDHPISVAMTSFSVVVVLGLAIFANNTLMRTALNRGIVLCVLIALILHDAVEIGAWIMGVDMATTHMISVVQWAGITAICSVFLDRAMIFPTLCFLVTAGAIVWSPAQRLWAMSASLGFMLAVMIYVWKMQARGRRIAGFIETLRPKR